MGIMSPNYNHSYIAIPEEEALSTGFTEEGMTQYSNDDLTDLNERLQTYSHLAAKKRGKTRVKQCVPTFVGIVMLATVATAIVWAGANSTRNFVGAHTCGDVSEEKSGGNMMRNSVTGDKAPESVEEGSFFASLLSGSTDGATEAKNAEDAEETNAVASRDEEEVDSEESKPLCNSNYGLAAGVAVGAVLLCGIASTMSGSGSCCSCGSDAEKKPVETSSSLRGTNKKEKVATP